MSSSQSLDLLLASDVKTSDGALGEEERLIILIVALAVRDVAARIIRCLSAVLNAATSAILAKFLTEQLEVHLQEGADAAIKIAARQEVCRKRCSASRAPSQSLPLLSQQASQLTVALDLDETLVSSYSARNIPQHLLEGEQRYFVVRYSPSSGCTDQIAVFPRPGVRAFLKQLSAFAEVILYTAGNAGYAGPVADILDPDGSIFAARLYRCSTVRTLCGQDYVKDLSRMGRSLAKTVLVDNDPFSGLLQPCNVLPTKAYYGEASDRLLMQDLLPYLKRLAELPDVRQPLTEDFKMAEYFRRQGYLLYEDPASGFLTAAASVIS